MRDKVSRDRETCPFCGNADLDYDEVDIGVGTLTSPPGCPACWSCVGPVRGDDGVELMAWIPGPFAVEGVEAFARLVLALLGIRAFEGDA